MVRTKMNGDEFPEYSTRCHCSLKKQSVIYRCTASGVYFVQERTGVWEDPNTPRLPACPPSFRCTRVHACLHAHTTAGCVHTRASMWAHVHKPHVSVGHACVQQCRHVCVHRVHTCCWFLRWGQRAGVLSSAAIFSVPRQTDSRAPSVGAEFQTASWLGGRTVGAPLSGASICQVPAARLELSRSHNHFRGKRKKKMNGGGASENLMGQGCLQTQKHPAAFSVLLTVPF